MSKLSSKELIDETLLQIESEVAGKTLALSFTKLRTKLRKMRGGADNEAHYNYINYMLVRLYAFYYSFQPAELQNKRVRNEMYKDFEEITNEANLKLAREMYNELQRLYLQFGIDNDDFHAYYIANHKAK